MRTTVTLDADVEQLIRARMRQRGISFKRALNDSVREANASPRPAGPITRPASLGVPTVNLDRALQLAADLEDEELVRRMRAGR